MPMGRNKSTKHIVPLRTKLKKDPGVPRLPDLKARVRNTGKERKPPVARDTDAIMVSEPTLATLASDSASISVPATTNDDDVQSSQKTKEQIKKHYIRTLHKVIDQSDIVILVLDARDPEGCRSRLVEEEVRRRESEGKKLVFVLNKIDLVPRANAQAWLRHLRHSTPTLPFRSTTSSQRANLSSSTAPSLLRLLKAYKPSAAQSVTVGVVGYPNVGKSSLINSLKRAKVCAVAAQPGHTKDLQQIQLERGLKIVDSPGVVFDEEDTLESGGHQRERGNILLRNVIKVEDVPDPIAVVEEILARTDEERLQKLYSLPGATSTLEFLTMLALSSGRLLKGGTPDILSAAKHVLNDWNQQKIPYFSVPPAVHPSLIPSTVLVGGAGAERVIAPGAEGVGQAQILTSLSKPFVLDGLFGAADVGAFGGEVRDEVMVDGEGMDEDGNEMESDDLRHVIPRKRSRSLSLSVVSSAAAPPPSTSTFSIPREPPPHALRKPKRQRRTKDVPSYDAPPDADVLKGMDRSNPLSRRVLKKNAKTARRAANRRDKVEEGGGMEVDTLAFTFLDTT